MTLAVAAWLIILAVLIVGFLIVLRRMSLLVARTRNLERFQREVSELDGRVGAVVEPLEASLGDIRRHAGDPGALRGALDGAQASLRTLAAEAEALRPPEGLESLAAAFRRELERAERAAEMLEHGLDTLLAVRGGRELEAQTTLKRADLSLRTAREGCAQVTARAASVTPADLVPRGGWRGRDPSGAAGGRPTQVIPGWDADDGQEDHRM
jgi:hypothetical protein